MKSLELLLYLLCMAGSLVGYFLLTPPLSLIVICLCLAFAVWSVLAGDNSGKFVLRLGGLAWTMDDFVRGWLITGRTGSGKTLCAINTITFQLFQNVKDWGGVCLDQKGLYWEIVVETAAHFGRETPSNRSTVYDTFAESRALSPCAPQGAICRIFGYRGSYTELPGARLR